MPGKNEKSLKLYEDIVRKKTNIIISLIFFIAVSFVINILAGSAGLSLRETMETVFNRADNVNSVIVWNIRMPVALSAILVGGILGIGGCEMQTVLNNPMASPYTLGLSSAASFGAALAIILDFKVLPFIQNILISLNAFLCTLLAAFIIIQLAHKFDWDRGIIILFGIAMNFLFGAMTTFLQYIAHESNLQAFIFWSFGNLNKIGWDKVLILFIVFIIVFILFFKKSWELTAMTLGDINAVSMGIDVKKLRRYSIFLIAILSATSVSFAGTIGFIGIVSPHIARMLSGEDQRYFMVISALVGALILSVSSIMSKVFIPGVILPIGLVTSMVGIPFFIYLIINHRGGYK